MMPAAVFHMSIEVHGIRSVWKNYILRRLVTRCVEFMAQRVSKDVAGIFKCDRIGACRGEKKGRSCFVRMYVEEQRCKCIQRNYSDEGNSKMSTVPDIADSTVAQVLLQCGRWTKIP